MRSRFTVPLAVLLLAACSRNPPPPSPANIMVREPHADSIESVILLIGDAGEATMDHSPILHRLRTEASTWASSMPDSSTLVLWLGDNVYPGGLREFTHEGWAQDSTHLASQLQVIDGDTTIRKQVRAIFIPGNHDWGHKPGAAGVRRIRNMQEFIDRNSRTATLLPRDAQPGPAIVDVGRHLRFLIIDTAWWLLDASADAKREMILGVERAMRSAGNREVILVAHHPWESGSSHGGLTPFWKTLGIKWLLNKSGAALQDINSLPYRDLKNRITEVFEQVRRPLLWIGGHDHALQVIRSIGATDPVYSVISGAGSKSSVIGPRPGSLFQRDEPGFMRLIVQKNGAIDLWIVSAPPDFLNCTSTVPARRDQCMNVGVESFRSVFSYRLRAPATGTAAEGSRR